MLFADIPTVWACFYPTTCPCPFINPALTVYGEEVSIDVYISVAWCTNKSFQIYISFALCLLRGLAILSPQAYVTEFICYVEDMWCSLRPQQDSYHNVEGLQPPEWMHLIEWEKRLQLKWLALEWKLPKIPIGNGGIVVNQNSESQIICLI